VALSYSQNGTPVPAPTNPGRYDVVATVDDANYVGSATGTLVIERATERILLPLIGRQAP
jgi:hypothetical protein